MITSETTQVETFEQEEVCGAEPAPPDADSQKLAAELGLTGQEAFYSKSADGQVKRVPFRAMALEERQVYSVLCPKVTAVEKYADGPIPRRVLEVLKRAQESALFSEIKVWSAEAAEVHDPVLVGYKGSSYDHTCFILARWGSELLPLEQLLERAKLTVLRKVTDGLQAAKAALARDEAMLKLGSVPLASKVPQYQSMTRSWE